MQTLNDNPSFEWGTGWTFDDGGGGFAPRIYALPDVAHTGLRGVLLLAYRTSFPHGPVYAQSIVSDAVAVAPGRRVKASLWYRRAGNQTGSGKLTLRCDGREVYVEQPGTDWALLELPEWPASGDPLSVCVLASRHTHPAWYVDDVVLLDVGEEPALVSVPGVKMASKVEIINQALTHIGIADLLESVNEDTQAANLARLHYDAALLDLLTEREWGFATRWKQLVLSADTPPDGWSYAYKYPDDCLVLHGIDNEQDISRRKDWPPHRVLHGDTSRIIVCNVEDAYAYYTVNVQDPNWMSPTFRSLLAIRLAKRLAAPLGATEAAVQALNSNDIIATNKACAADARENPHPVEPDPDWIAER